MSTFFERQLKRVLPCILIMIIFCCFFVINAGAETIIQLEEKKLFGAPDVSTSSLARSVDVDALGEYLREELVKCPDQVDISSFNLAYNDTNTTILSNIIWYESPELFHINGWSMSISNGILKTVIPRYEYSAQEYTKMYNDCLEQVNIILYGIAGNSNLTDVQKALLIHDRLAVHCEYDVSNYNNNTIPDESYTMYGALTKGVSVCQGYAESYMYLLEKAGIESRLCSSDDLNHAWNIVTINGKEYHVDVTWDDPTMDKTGQVLHTNFLRSSNGIYSTGHDTYDYDTSPTDTTYDNYFWQDSETAFQSIGDEIYYIDNEFGAIKKYSNKSTVVECTDRWPASASGSYWVGSFSRLGSDGTNLYYNLSEDVYKYTISTGKTEKIWSPDLSAGALFRIYGFMYKDGYLICDINDTPNFELNDKKNYQQKYLYHDQSSSTLQSISISTAPKKTDYYIGDQLNTDGLQLKLNYSNGLTKYITSGFTVSGFSSSSSGSKKVTVSYNGCSTTFNVNIKTPSIALDASSVKIELKDFCRLTATTDPKNVSVKWSSSNNNVATVSNGEIASVAIGTATVTAEFSYNGYTYKSSCNVTVECTHSSVVTIKGTAATCTEAGLTEGKKCSVCGTVTVAQQTIAKKGHTEITVKGKEATCTEAGLTEGKKCSVCGTVTVAQQTIAKKGHTEITVKGKEATCAEAGLTEGKKCSVCGTITVTQQTIAKKGHTEITVKGKEATCAEAGLTEGKKCSVCGTVTVAQQTIAKKGHTEITVKGKEASCTEAGLTEGKKCSVCGTVTVEQQTIAKKGHTEITVKGKEATCTEAGLTDGKKCSVCETVIKEQKIIAALGHTWKNATCTTAKTCTVCKATEGTVPGHTKATREENRKEASCSKAGSYNLVTYCTVCKAVIKTETKTIPATGNHVYATETKRVASTCKTAGYVVKACGCGETKTETLKLDANNHEKIAVINAVAATCTEAGLTEGKKCSVCGTVTVAQQTIAKKGHTEITVKGKEATCTEAGLTDGKKCSVCGTVTVAQKQIAKIGHKEATREENRKEASCKNNGSYNLVTYCSVCKAVIKTETKTIPATGNHVYATETKRVASTCKTAGYVVKACGCGETKTETLKLDANNHEKIVVVNAVAATCTKAGLTEGKKCSACNTVTVTQKQIAKTGHKEVTVKGKEATCSETGLTDGKKCSVCGTVTVAQREIAKKRHSEITVKGKDATCSETGLTDGKKCSVCGTVTVAQREIAKKRHSEITVKGKDATCSETGLTDGKKCSVCGTVTVVQKEIAKKRHWTVKIPGKAPTETNTGLTDGEKCIVCGSITKEQQIIPELNHKHNYTQSVINPTCTENGYTTYICKCGDAYKDDYTDAFGHKTEIIAGKKATCTEPGLTDGEKCTVCDEVTVAQEEVTASGHKEETVPGKVATCTDAGLTEGKKCSVCGKILVSQNEIVKLGHTPGEWETVKESQVGSDGLMQQKCTVCSEVLDEKPIPALDENPKNALGDANNDGKINAADARLVLRISAKIDAYSDDQIAYLDLNKDKKINAADARILLRISAKIESIESYIK